MALRMAHPWKDPKSGNWYLRERVPRAVLPLARGKKVTLPIGEGQTTITLSDTAKAALRTQDSQTAKERYRIASGALQAFYAALRDGPTPLGNKALVALSGEVYRQWVADLEDEPGEEGIWQHVRRLQSKARETGKLDQWLGPLVDNLLREKGLVLDSLTRERLLAGTFHQARSGSTQR